jgi:hypothetical protein
MLELPGFIVVILLDCGWYILAPIDRAISLFVVNLICEAPLPPVRGF